MPHIELAPGVPGIRGLFQRYPNQAKVLSQLAETLLRGPSSLSTCEREAIAAFVSRKNDCLFCCESHAAASRANGPATLVDQALKDLSGSDISPKMKSLFTIAGAVASGGKSVTTELVTAARSAGATEDEVHETILIASAFCMFNRYVDGHATIAPPAGDPSYVQMGEQLATVGYDR